MNIDERLECLTERHEALTQSVEMLVADHQLMAGSFREMAEENKQRDRRMAEVMEGIARLLHVAEIHEHRISELEGGEG